MHQRRVSKVKPLGEVIESANKLHVGLPSMQKESGDIEAN